MRGIQRLRLHYNFISDIIPLTELQTLIHLNVRGNPINTIAATLLSRITINTIDIELTNSLVLTGSVYTDGVSILSGDLLGNDHQSNGTDRKDNSFQVVTYPRRSRISVSWQDSISSEPNKRPCFFTSSNPIT